MTPTEILGIQIKMLELDENEETEFRRPLYGISKIIIKRPGSIF